MERNRKPLAVTLSLLLVIAMVLGGCGGKANTDASGSAGNGVGEQEKVKLKIAWWGSQNRHDYTQKLLDRYTELNPNVTFEATPSGWDGYFDKLSAQAAGGNLPDIFQMDYSYISTYSNNKLLADLWPYADSGVLNLDNIDENLVNSGKANGKLTGVPLSSSMLALTYNPEVFEKAGVQVPDGNWTWADFTKLTGQIKDKAGVFGIEKLADIRILQYWIRQSGSSLYTSDGNKLGYEDDAIVAQFLTMLKQLTDEKIMPNPDEWSQIASKGKEAQPVVTGDAGITFDWNNFPVIAAAGNPNLQLLTPPLGEGGTKGLWTSPGMFFSVSESSQYKEEGAKFIDWFVNNEEANRLINGERGIPVSSAIRESLEPSLTEQQQVMFEYMDKAAPLTTPLDAPEPSGHAEIVNVFTDITKLVLYEKTSPEEAAASFRTKASEILARSSQ